MSNTAFDTYLKTGPDEVQKEIEPGIALLHAYLHEASPKSLAQLAEAGGDTLRALVKTPANTLRLLPGVPDKELLNFLASLPEDVLKFLEKVPRDPPHLARARSKIDESHDVVKNWFDDWKDHSTGILNVHKRILDGTHATGGDMFAALARETVSVYATAFHWLLRPYVKKK